jgi:hypothetical protein
MSQFTVNHCVLAIYLRLFFLCTLSGCTLAAHQYGCARTRPFVFSFGTLVRLLALSCFSCSVMGSMSERMPQRME